MKEIKVKPPPILKMIEFIIALPPGSYDGVEDLHTKLQEEFETDQVDAFLSVSVITAIMSLQIGDLFVLSAALKKMDSRKEQ